MRHNAFLRPLLGALAGAALLAACRPGTDSPNAADKPLPILGEADVLAPGDTVYPRIPAFRLLDQDSSVVTPATFAGKVYIADFFFATCPSICPKMQSQMLRVYEKYKDDPRVSFLSHTIDPEHDSVPVLRDYAQRLGVPSARQWHFATAPRDTIFRLAGQYMVAAQRDSTAPGGAVHSGAFVLVDPQRHVRGQYDGVNPQEVDRLLAELPRLLKELGPAPTATAKQ